MMHRRARRRADDPCPELRNASLQSAPRHQAMARVDRLRLSIRSSGQDHRHAALAGGGIIVSLNRPAATSRACSARRAREGGCLPGP